MVAPKEGKDNERAHIGSAFDRSSGDLAQRRRCGSHKPHIPQSKQVLVHRDRKIRGGAHEHIADDVQTLMVTMPAITRCACTGRAVIAHAVIGRHDRTA
jgi:hypothetical protein